jgi:hypothetical protein
MTHEQDTQPLQPVTEGDTPPIAYRCVCGEVISLDPLQGGACQACGRNYHARVLRELDTRSFSDSIAPFPVEMADSEDRTGQRFGHYRIVQRLGAGGMGEVYQALDESLQRYVALKVIRGQTSPVRDRADTDRLLQEAVAQARLNHPNVVHIYYVGREGESPFLAMELVGGKTLADRLKRGPLPFDQVVEIALQVSSALLHAGSFDIVHGDIKPSNLLLADRGTVKLSDFGLARRMSIRDGSGAINGSPNYICPEGARGEPTDVRSDMYSLGVLLFEMTFGRLPYTFRDSSVMERREAHQFKPIEFPKDWPKGVPEGFREVLDKLLAKSPDERYQFYGQLRDDLLRMRPTVMPRAGRLQRGAAWVVDLAWVIGCQQLVSAIPWDLWSATASGPAPDDKGGPGSLVECGLVLLPVMLFCLLQVFWRSPAKHLFQIRIADATGGLRPTRWTLLGRALWQLGPAWIATLAAWFAIFDLSGTFWIVLLAILIGLPLAADILFALFQRRCISLHDRFFATRVILGIPDRDAVESADRRQHEDEEYWERQYWSPLKRAVGELRDRTKPDSGNL